MGSGDICLISRWSVFSGCLRLVLGRGAGWRRGSGPLNRGTNAGLRVAPQAVFERRPADYGPPVEELARVGDLFVSAIFASGLPQEVGGSGGLEGAQTGYGYLC